MSLWGLGPMGRAGAVAPWCPADLNPIFWAGALRPATRLWQSRSATASDAGTALAAGDPVGRWGGRTAHPHGGGAVVGTPPLATAPHDGARARLAIYPPAGRRNLLSESEFRHGLSDVEIPTGAIEARSATGFEGAIRLAPASSGSSSFAKRLSTPDAGAVRVLSFHAWLEDGTEPLIAPGNSALGHLSINPFGQATILPAAVSKLAVGGGLWRLWFSFVQTQASGRIVFTKFANNLAAPVHLSGLQCESAALSPYQRLRGPYEGYEAGKGRWQLLREAEGRLQIDLPVGSYHLALLGGTGAMTRLSLAHAGGPCELLQLAHVVDALLCPRPITDTELALLTAYWSPPSGAVTAP